MPFGWSVGFIAAPISSVAQLRIEVLAAVVLHAPLVSHDLAQMLDETHRVRRAVAHLHDDVCRQFCALPGSVLTVELCTFKAQPDARLA